MEFNTTFIEKYKEDPITKCWNWTASLDMNGYGRYRVPNKETVPAYRYSYEVVNGPIAGDLEIDHLCNNKLCVNPTHLEAISHAENMRRSKNTIGGKNLRKTHCTKGHEYSEENTRINKRTGGRQCKECSREAVREHRRKLKEPAKKKKKKEKEISWACDDHPW